MAYTKTNWVNGYTPLNASNMNKIEEGIYNNDTFLSSLDIRVDDLEGKIGQGGIGSVVINGNGNALTNASYTPSTKILNFEKNNTFALDSDLDSVNEKNLYHLGAYDSVSGNVITRQTGYIVLDGSSDENWASYDTGFWAYITIDDITPTASQQELGQFIVSRGNVVTIHTMINTSSDIQIGLDNKLLNIRPNVSDVNTLNSFIQWLSQNPIIIQYKLATPYTEEIIENQPLNTLDQSGSQWLRSEWEKGLNLYYKNNYTISKYGQTLVANDSSITLNGTNTKGSDNYLPFYPFRDLEVGKTYTLKLSDTTGFVLDCWFEGWRYMTDSNGLLTIYLTQGLKETDSWRIVTPTDSSFKNTLINIMINEGSHAYPYQEYKGQIVREKQLNDQIVKVKIFSGDTSTFNDFKSWVESNNERIISIMYYDRASGDNNYYNVIFGSGGGIYKYINSEGTFDNVSLSDSSINEPDIIKVYYK